jgi:hypothetical protein
MSNNTGFKSLAQFLKSDFFIMVSIFELELYRWAIITANVSLFGVVVNFVSPYLPLI